MTNEPCTVRAEHGDCGAHPTPEPNPWTDEDVGDGTESLSELWNEAAETLESPSYEEETRAVLAALAPRLVERERAAKVAALRWAADSFDGWDQADAREHCLDLANEVERGER